ncbi:MAG: HD domain-containing protein [Lachnospiraceae bacterium]|nr:HD domain-containing protein [Lachnospiraceae bacterium]
MEQTVSFRTCKQIFEQYASRYDRTDGRVELKIIHTNHVVAIMEQLCKERRLDPHLTNLALICAQFHDIGRFEQLKRYDTFLDHMSVNHALLSCRILWEDKILDKLSKVDRQMVLTAIANHNKLEIDRSVPKDFLPLCKLIRDADKCDIFRVFAEENMVDVVGVPDSEVAKETISPAVLQAVCEHRCIDKTIRKTYLDYWVSFIGYFFDLNYPESFAIARKQGYYRRPFERVTFADARTGGQVEKVFSVIEHYIDERLKDKAVPESLQRFFREHNSCALAFSGGVDSAYLLYAAGICRAKVHAFYVATPFQPAFEREDAKRLAEALNVGLTFLPFDILSVPAVRQNPADRCYHCKRAIFQTILQAAADAGFCKVLDGTNASDDAGDRPGMRALKELKVLSPLRLCGLTKKEIREYSRIAGLFTWNKPAYACLATRVPTATPLDSRILKKIEWAETELSRLGFSDFRVRVFEEPAGKDTFDDNRLFSAKIQLTEADFPLLLETYKIVYIQFKTEFQHVLLDLETRGGS